MTQAELLAEFACSIRTIRRWTNERGFPKPDAFPGRRVLWSRKTIEAWLKERERQSPQPKDRFARLAP